MGLLLIPVPLFNKHTTTVGYLFRYLLSGENPNLYDPYKSPLLEALNRGGVAAFSGGKPLFVPIDSLLLLADLDIQCTEPSGKIVFLLEDAVPIDEEYMSSMANLRSLGYRFALMGDAAGNEPDTLLGICDYRFLPVADPDRGNRKASILAYKRRFRHLEHIACDIATRKQFNAAIRDGVDYMQGQFYQAPATEGETKITPLKANLVHLLNNVRDENFEFSTIAGIVQRDPALSFSLMRFVNSPFIGVPRKIKTIQHAVTLLGQQEVRKWVTAAVFRSLGTDQPGELTRLSLVRAKLAENLAPLFAMKAESQSLFLMGLFSMLHLALQTSIEKTLELVSVSDDIAAALSAGTGRYYPVLHFIRCYEQADWDSVLQYIAQRKLDMTQVNDAYVGAVSWYNSLITERVRPVKR